MAMSAEISPWHPLATKMMISLEILQLPVQPLNLMLSPSPYSAVKFLALVSAHSRLGVGNRALQQRNPSIRQHRVRFQVSQLGASGHWLAFQSPTLCFEFYPSFVLHSARAFDRHFLALFEFEQAWRVPTLGCF